MYAPSPAGIWRKSPHAILQVALSLYAFGQTVTAIAQNASHSSPHSAYAKGPAGQQFGTCPPEGLGFAAVVVSGVAAMAAYIWRHAMVSLPVSVAAERTPQVVSQAASDLYCG